LVRERDSCGTDKDFQRIGKGADFSAPFGIQAKKNY